MSSLNFAMDTIDDAIQCWKHPWGTNHAGEGRTQAHRAQGLPRAHSRPGVFSWSEVEASGHDKAVGRTHAWIEKNTVEARAQDETAGATVRIRDYRRDLPGVACKASRASRLSRLRHAHG